mmetsp:Transcript_36611/g.91202  ORF Transcript_36611/g.91202 Transcript_36611/m.91202 type:complete len:89 (-) Transcript_36611:114-380(-)
MMHAGIGEVPRLLLSTAVAAVTAVVAAAADRLGCAALSKSSNHRPLPLSVPLGIGELHCRRTGGWKGAVLRYQGDSDAFAAFRVCWAW